MPGKESLKGAAKDKKSRLVLRNSRFPEVLYLPKIFRVSALVSACRSYLEGSTDCEGSDYRSEEPEQNL